MRATGEITRHHELPRYYLRGFCSPEEEGHIWVFERNQPFMPARRRGHGNPHLRGINTAAVHPEGYGRYESQLARKEHLADEAIRKVRESQPIALMAINCSNHSWPSRVRDEAKTL